MVVLELAKTMLPDASTPPTRATEHMGTQRDINKQLIHTTHRLHSQYRFGAHFAHQRNRDPRAPRTSRSQPRGTHHRAHLSVCASRVPEIATWLPPGGAQSPYPRPGGRQQPESRMHEIAGCRAPTALPRARIDAGACHMMWGVEGRGWVRVETQKSSRATVSQAAHEQRDRCACPR